jgi:hypothetical protein
MGLGCEYKEIEGVLFVKGKGDFIIRDSESVPALVHHSDVYQGELGDCSLMASLASIAKQNPEIIRNMITINPDGTYTVYFYKKVGPGEYRKVAIVVDNAFPVKKYSNEVVFADYGDLTNKVQPELWVMIVEKAYAKFKGSYNEIVGEDPSVAMEELTGKESYNIPIDKVTIEALAGWDDKGYAIVAYSLQEKKPPYPKISRKHAYYILGVAGGNILLADPRGNGIGRPVRIIQLSEEVFKQNFLGISINPLK